MHLNPNVNQTPFSYSNNFGNNKSIINNINNNINNIILNSHLYIK